MLTLMLAAALGAAEPAALPSLPPAPRETAAMPKGGGQIIVERAAAGAPDQPKAAKAARARPGPGVLTDLRVTVEGSASGPVPVTVGQVFAPGDLRAGDLLRARLADGAELPLQVDVKARHADGSVRHAVLSTLLPAQAAGKTSTIELTKAAGKAAQPAMAADALKRLLGSGLRATVRVTIGARDYSLAVDKLLASGRPAVWLDGPLVHEWLISSPLLDDAGRPHPHLAARIAVRSYGQPGQARIDVTLENDWAFEPEPQNYQYDAAISVGGKTAFERAGMTHYHHARWRKVLWWGAAPEVQVEHDSAYLIASRALPNYDQGIDFPEARLAALARSWSAANTQPMGNGLANAAMPTTGGRPELGLLPAWGATYLLTMDARARTATLGMGELAGSWSAHYRDRKTDRPVSVVDHPYMTIYGQRSDTFNAATKQFEAFPACPSVAACATPLLHDASHQPGFAYLPYLVTGDYFYLEELQFWAMWNALNSNPGYREHAKGLVKSDQVRGQAWSLRTLGEAAYITPDADPLKQQFTTMLGHNLAWYNAHYTFDPAANTLGVLTHGYALAYANGTGIAPWMDDFFTAAVGHVAELGFTEALPLLKWKARFAIARMTDPDSCWIDAASYTLTIRPSASAPFFATLGQAYRASHPEAHTALPCGSAQMAAQLRLKTGEMTGYASSEAGFPSNMQPALAFAADVGGAAGKAAWERFMQRSVQPDYSLGPQFAIVPRGR
ncbi:MAG: hypothetical protein ACLGI6_14565 [Gammaproteobacteria bacterium]